MVGQERLQSVFNKLTLETIPHSIMLVGESGCGKHTLLGMLSDRLGLPIENISEKLTYEKIAELTLSPICKIYVVDKQVSIAGQNSLLKFIEEPPNTAYIFILCENKDSFLPTIQGRCTILSFSPYTEDELLHFTNDRKMIMMARTPGKILKVSSEDNKWVFDLNNTILTKISSASIPNTLTLVGKFGYGKDDKFPIDLEMSLLANSCIDMYSQTDDCRYLSAYTVTSRYRNKFTVPNVDKQKLFSLYLLDLKGCLKQG